ncbi:MAG: succinate-semialdehyde dehydrogenase (NADP(+)) [Thermoanaerobaculia bacterium]|nr:succinate-semialdehyde dehydrogenase (NADP(+)) [Thermoanaerobaculia bacterium]
MAVAAKPAKPPRKSGSKAPKAQPHPDAGSVARRPAVLDRLPAFARLVAASAGGGAGRDAVEVRSPFDHSLIGTLPRSTPADVVLAQARLRLAQEDWAMRPFAERAKIFLRFHDRVLDRQEEILDLIQLEAGKARKHALEEVLDAAIVARYYAVHAAEILAPQSRKGALPGLTQTRQYQHPKGIIGIISPWNYPLSMGITDAIPALLAGNAVLAKPDLQTPFSQLWALDLLIECGLPEEIMLVVAGEGPVLGPAILAASDYLQFTGSTPTGRRLAAEAGSQLMGCSLELGGKNPMLVLADADLDAAVAGAVRGSFSSAGQLCISIERLYVHESLFDRFVAEFVRATSRLKLGPALDWTCDIGSLASPKQLATVTRHIEDAVAKGVRVEIGGKARPDMGPLFFEPTILTGVTPDMLLFADETFGPVVSVYPFASNQQAIELANATEYGLNASIWSRDTELACRMATRIHAGTVNINEAYAAAWGSVEAPMGGFKSSGLGRRHGAEGILKYTEAQTVAVQRGMAIAAPTGVPDEVFGRWMTQALRALRRMPGLR